MIVVKIIAMNSAPFTLYASKIPAITKPMIASNAVPEVISPSVKIAPPWITMPAFTRPMNAMKRPIPTEIAFLMFCGIELMIASRTLKNDNKMKIRPSKNTAVNANSGDLPIPSTTVYAKNALRPIPGASANGKLAKRPITSVATKEETAVAVNTLPMSRPAAFKVSGLTIKIYAIVIKVVRPAKTSVLTFVP